MFRVAFSRLLYAVNHLDTYLPSIASIMGDLYDLTLSTIRR